MKALRSLHRQVRTVKPWLERVLNLLDWADWKTWVWYGLLGLERLSGTLLVWAKRQRNEAELRYVNGRFVVVPKRRA